MIDCTLVQYACKVVHAVGGIYTHLTINSIASVTIIEATHIYYSNFIMYKALRLANSMFMVSTDAVLVKM